MTIRSTQPDDLDQILEIHRTAFNSAEEPALVKALLADPTAQPVVSLIWEDAGQALGHVLLTQARAQGLDLYLLAPLAVRPGHQGRGIGTGLIAAGRANAAPAPVATFGDPAYYGRFGFVPAVDLGLLPPHDSALSHPGAWQVAGAQPLRPPRRVHCAKPLMPAQYWAV